MRCRDGCALCAPAEAAPAAAASPRGGAAEVLTGPGGQRLAGADRGPARSPASAGGCQGARRQLRT